jgi:hypothetical protein
MWKFTWTVWCIYNCHLDFMLFVCIEWWIVWNFWQACQQSSELLSQNNRHLAYNLTWCLFFNNKQWAVLGHLGPPWNWSDVGTWGRGRLPYKKGFGNWIGTFCLSLSLSILLSQSRYLNQFKVRSSALFNKFHLISSGKIHLIHSI